MTCRSWRAVWPVCRSVSIWRICAAIITTAVWCLRLTAAIRRWPWPGRALRQRRSGLRARSSGHRFQS
jgi:hypothetical protein